MNYAWDAVLQAEKDNRSRNDLRFVEAVNPSPYIEVSMTDLNLETPEENRIEVNPLYRFEEVFGRLFNKNVEGIEKTRELFFDICMHYAVQLDLREGLLKEDYYCWLLTDDINCGTYGSQARERFTLFDKSSRKILIYSFLQLLKSGNYREEFRIVVKRLYPDAIIYENNETAYEMLVYLGTEDCRREHEKAAFLAETFLPVQETVHFFYRNHFGIIGVDETMALDEMVIF